MSSLTGAAYAKAMRAATSARKRKQPSTPQFYEISRILGHREVAGTTEYRVRWKGFGQVGDEWVKSEDVTEEARATYTRARDRKYWYLFFFQKRVTFQFLTLQLCECCRIL